jgi:copper(I)-binding protein
MGSTRNVSGRWYSRKDPAAVSRAQQNSTARRRLVPAALGFGLVLALAGCGAGQITQTDTQIAAVNGASGQAGPVGVRNAQLAFPANAARYYPKGSDAPLVASVVNDGSSADRLVSVSSPAAASVNVQGSAALPAGFAVTAAEPAAGQSATASPSAPTSSSAGSPAPSTGTSAPSAGQPSGASPGASTSAGPLPVGKISITLTGLNRDVRPGETIKVTFVFQNAGPVTLDVPIGPATENARP